MKEQGQDRGRTVSRDAFWRLDLRRKELVDSLHCEGVMVGFRLSLITPQVAIPELERMLVEALDA